MQAESVYFKNDREQTLYSEGVHAGLTQSSNGVPDDILTEREAWVLAQGVLVTLNPSN